MDARVKPAHDERGEILPVIPGHRDSSEPKIFFNPTRFRIGAARRPE
jgi:hypothetical protein